jgi:hypothetical protein
MAFEVAPGGLIRPFTGNALALLVAVRSQWAVLAPGAAKTCEGIPDKLSQSADSK